MDMQMIRKNAEARHEHARDCRKPLDACKLCKQNVEWFGALPVNVLSDVLAEELRGR